MHRRDFVKVGAALASTPLPPVIVSEEQVIRTVTGLRPYRLSGFALRAESLNGKLLIHNYGHGGCGVTLSWGTAKLAADIAYQEEKRRAAVIGCGAVGLASARLLQDRGYDVTIYARELPPETTSNTAGALWTPITIADDDRHSPEFDAQLAAASRFAYRYFQTMVGDRYGVSWVPVYFLDDKPEYPLPWFWSVAPEIYSLTTLGPDQHPFPTPYAHLTHTLLIDPTIYLAAILSDFRIAGGKVITREFRSLGDVARLDEPVVINATGLGAKALVGDDEVLPIKGQTTFLRPQPDVKYGMVSNTEDIYMFSRRDSILLGGSHERNVWTLEPDEAVQHRILSGNRRIFSSMRS